MGDVGRWLEDRGLGRYAEAFRANDVTADVLPELTDADLRELGLSLGHRRLLLKAIKATAEGASAEEATTFPETGWAVERPPAPTHSTPRHSDPTTPESLRPQSEAERRQLTVMFVDLVGSTALSAALDPEDMREVIRAYQDACAGAIGRFDGHVAKYMGDGVLAYFGWPRAHEDDVERALRAGLDLVTVVARPTAPNGQSLACRVGIATGLVVVGDLVGEGGAEEHAVVGDTPNLAARLQALAEPGRVVIAEATRRLLGTSFDLQDLGLLELKGLTEPVAAFAVLGERALESRFEARSGPALPPMVGRDQELALLLDRWMQSKAGDGQGVLLMAEAGIGKSRISRALLDALANEPHTRVRYQCSPFHADSALWPVIQQLSPVAGLAPNQCVDEQLDRVEALLGRAVEEVGGLAPLFASLLGLDGTARYGELNLSPQVQRARTLDGLVAQLVGLAARQPVLVVLEDAHWIDPTTLELIEQPLDRIATTRVLFILTSRPDRQPALAAHPHVTRLTLNRLSRAGAEAIVIRLGGGTLPDETIDTIVARADGVPLFVEELTKAVLETGETTVPGSLHDSLMARLDRLPEVKELAQIAACIGREFEYGLLAAIAGRPEAALAGALEKLMGAELIFCRGTPPEATYRFKHALVRDAAYGSLLKQRARRVHARIAAAVVDRASHGANLPHDFAATHLLAAGRERDALPHMLAAATLASQRYAYPEALNWLTRMQTTMEQLHDDDEQFRKLQMDLYVTLTPILMAVQGYAEPKTVATAERAVELCTEVQDFDRLLPVMFGRLSAHSAAGEIHSALGIARQIREIGVVRGNSPAKLVGNRTVGFCRLLMGQLNSASKSLECALAIKKDHHLYDFRFGQDPGTTAKVLLATVKHLQGYTVTAEKLAIEAHEEANMTKHPLTNAYVSMYRCLMIADRCQFAELASVSALLRRTCEQYGIAQWELLGSFYMTWTRLKSGESGICSRFLEFILDRHRERGFRLHMPHFLRMLATALVEVGRWGEAKRCLDEAFAMIAQSEERWVEPALLRCRASLFLHQDADQSRLAEACLEECLGAAAAQGARLSELRAARDLARLWAERGERWKALDLLEPVYGWFTEGFDTRDLVEARQMLEELR